MGSVHELSVTQFNYHSILSVIMMSVVSLSLNFHLCLPQVYPKEVEGMRSRKPGKPNYQPKAQHLTPQ